MSPRSMLRPWLRASSFALESGESPTEMWTYCQVGCARREGAQSVVRFRVIRIRVAGTYQQLPVVLYSASIRVVRALV
eukprot:718039-Pleurochrysis_carterae.AAC.1